MDDDRRSEFGALIKKADTLPSLPPDQIKQYADDFVATSNALDTEIGSLSAQLAPSSAAIKAAIDKSNLPSDTSANNPNSKENLLKSLLSSVMPDSPEDRKAFMNDLAGKIFPGDRQQQARQQFVDAVEQRYAAIPQDVFDKMNRMQQEQLALQKSDQPALTRLAFAQALSEAKGDPAEVKAAILDALVRSKTPVASQLLVRVADKLGITQSEFDAAKVAYDKQASVSAPEAPVAAKPEAPVAAKPEAPVAAKPEAPVAAKPEAPVAAKPEAPVAAKPEAPVAAKPEAPVAAKPEAPVAAKPEAPVAAKPEAPVVASAAPEVTPPAVVKAPDSAPDATQKVVKPEAVDDGSGLSAAAKADLAKLPKLPGDAAGAIADQLSDPKSGRKFDKDTAAELDALVKAADATPKPSAEQIKAAQDSLDALFQAAKQDAATVKPALDANEAKIKALLANADEKDPAVREALLKSFTTVPPLTKSEVNPDKIFSDQANQKALADLIDERYKTYPTAFFDKMTQIQKQQTDLGNLDQPALTRLAVATALVKSLNDSTPSGAVDRVNAMANAKVLDAALLARTSTGRMALSEALDDAGFTPEMIQQTKAAVVGLSDTARDEAIFLLANNSPADAAKIIAANAAKQPLDADTSAVLKALVKDADSLPGLSKDEYTKLNDDVRKLNSDIVKELAPNAQQLSQNDSAIQDALKNSAFKSDPASLREAFHDFTSPNAPTGEQRDKVLAGLFPDDSQKQLRVDFAKLLDDRSKLIPADVPEKQKSLEKLIKTMEAVDQPALTRMYAVQAAAGSVDSSASADAKNAAMNQIKDQLAEARMVTQTQLGYEHLSSIVKGFGMDMKDIQALAEAKSKAAQPAVTEAAAPAAKPVADGAPTPAAKPEVVTPEGAPDPAKGKPTDGAVEPAKALAPGDADQAKLKAPEASPEAAKNNDSKDPVDPAKVNELA